MSLPIDNSTQLPGGTFTSGTPSYDNIKEWSINNTSNLYNTSLIGNVGIGTSAFNGYKLNINGSLNSTSLYQSGTLIDFSSYATNTNLTNNYYNKLSTDSLLNTKQNTLTAGTSLLGDGSAITNLTYGNISGKPSYFPADFNTLINKPTYYLTDWTTTISNKPTYFPPDPTIYYTKTQTDTLLNAKQASISTYTITGATGGTFGFSAGTLTLGMPNNYTQNMSISNLITPTAFTYKGTELTTTLNTKQDSISTYTITGATGGTFGFSAGTLTLGMPTNYTANISISNLITPTAFTYKGTELTTTLNTKQNNLTFTSPLVNTANTITFNESAITTLTNFYNKTETNTLLNAKQPNLTFTSPLVNTTNTITFNESAVSTLTNFYNKTETNTLLNAKQASISTYTITGATGGTFGFSLGTLTLGMPNNYTQNMSISNLITPTSFLYQGTELLTTLNTKQNNLTFTSPLVNTTNTITFNESAVSTLTNFYNKTTSDGRYLQLSGGNMSGSIGFGTSPDSKIHIATPDSTTTTTNIFNFKNVSGYGIYATSTSIISRGNTLDFLSRDYNSGTITTRNIITLHPNGNVGIGTASPSSPIHISEPTGSSASSSTGSLIIDHENSGGQSSIVFRSKVNRGSDYGYISYIDTVLSTSYNYFNVDATATESAALILGSENDSTSSVGSGGPDSVIISPAGNIALTPRNNIIYISGNVGIGITNPSQKLHIDTGCLYITGNISNPGNATSVSLWNQANVGATISAYQFVVQTAGTTERLRIDSSGNVGIGITNPSQKLHINGSTTTNGKFIVGNDNSYPDLQLGSANGYNIGVATTAGAFSSSAQTGDMVIRSIETKRLILQANGGGNSGIIIDSANNTTISGVLTLNSAIIFKTDLWHNSTDGKNRFYFQPNGRTYFRGYGTPTLADNAFEFMNTAGTVILGINDNGNAFFLNQITCKLNVAAANPHDFIGIAYDNPGAGNYTLYIIQGSFTGFHRYFTNDELFDENEIQLFKDTYEGRIVVSTGKIATQIGEEIKYDKDGITIEDAHSIFELSRKKKDKRVIGVIGDRRRKTDNEKRLIVNSVGEGAIWVCNSNGNIENGDYITSSDYLGYGEKQDEIYLCNYTVAKATMDCDFQLDSPLYNCIEIQEGLRIAFIAATYHCG